MVSAKALCYEQKKKDAKNRSVSGQLASVMADELPMAVQIFGSEPDFMAEAARMIEANEYLGCESEVPPSAIDINMGCPVKKVTGNGEGSALLKNPALIGEIVTAVVKAVSIPVTVKIRAGWDKDSINAPEVATRAEFGDGTQANDLYYAVYLWDTKTNTSSIVGKISKIDKTAPDYIAIDATVEFKLVNGNTYSILFWDKMDRQGETEAMFTML